MLLYQRQPPQRNCQIVKLPLWVNYYLSFKFFKYSKKIEILNRFFIFSLQISPIVSLQVYFYNIIY